MTSNQPKTFARLLATQALFQIEATRRPYKVIIAELRATDPARLLDQDVEVSEVDHRLFEKVVERSIQEQAQIDQAIDNVLVEKWPIDHIDPTLRALFRAASGEFLIKKTPPKVVVNEYLEIAKSFDDKKETTAFANAVLDGLKTKLST